MRKIALFLAAILGWNMLAAAQTRPASAPVPGQTAQSRLDTTQRFLQTTLTSLQRAQQSNGGEYVARAIDGVTRTQQLVREAGAYVMAHPDEGILSTGPTPVETSKAKSMTVPAVARGRGSPASTPLRTALTDLNQALTPLTHDSLGPVIGDIGGYRVKIMDGIGKAQIDVLTAMEYADSTTTTAARRGRAGPGAAVTAPEPRWSASEPLTKNGLEVILQPSKSSFRQSETIVLIVTYRNVSTEAYRMPDEAAIPDGWIINASDAASGKAFYGAGTVPMATLANSPVTLRPGGLLVKVATFERPSFVQDNPGDPSSRRMAGTPKVTPLAPGKYRISLDIRLPKAADISAWQGENIVTNPIDVTIVSDTN